MSKKFRPILLSKFLYKWVNTSYSIDKDVQKTETHIKYLYIFCTDLLSEFYLCNAKCLRTDRLMDSRTDIVIHGNSILGIITFVAESSLTTVILLDSTHLEREPRRLELTVC